MKKFKPYYLLLIVSVLFFVIRLIINSNRRTFDLNIYDTYYIITEVDFYSICSVFLFLLSLMYLVLEKIKFTLFTLATKIHIIGTIVLIVLFTINQYYLNLQQLPNRYYVISEYDYHSINEPILYIILILILQMLFIMNIFASLIKKMSLPKTSR